MNWSDERYVRLYTRDSTDWSMLSFEAQGLLCLLLRKADRSGVIPVSEKHGLRSVFVMLGHGSRWKALLPSLEELIEDGVIMHGPKGLVFPNYIEAQEAQASPALKQKMYRDRVARQQEALGNATVTEGNDGVTSGNASVENGPDSVSGVVDPVSGAPDPLPQPCLPKPASLAGSLLSGKPDTSTPALALDVEPMQAPETGVERDVTEVLTYWQEVFSKQRSDITPGKGKARRSRVRARFREGYTVAQLKAAIDGGKRTDWVTQGVNGGKPLIEVDNLFKDGARVDDLIEAPTERAVQKPKGRASDHNCNEAWASRSST
jgi:hypothetical protein